MNTTNLTGVLSETTDRIRSAVDAFKAEIVEEEVGSVLSVSQGIVWSDGLGKVKSDELVLLGDENVVGMVMDLLPDRVGIVLLGTGEILGAGDTVRRTGRILDVPVSRDLVGRVIDPLGLPLDEKGPLPEEFRWPIEREAPPIMARTAVDKPLQTGLKVIDALIPIGHGQRELILGDRQTGKTAVAIDTIINQRDKDTICIYCAIGRRSSSIAKVVDELNRYEAMSYSIIVVAEGNDPPGLQFAAPYAATTIGEYFMEQGRDVLIVYDNLTSHSQAYRQISLLLRRPPGREAFPGDIFYVHSRLLERSTHLRSDAGGGSLTALPIIETEAQNISAYIPTNLISITDGQIYLSPDLFQKGILPAVDVGKSVSRVGGKAQLPAYRKVAGDLRLSYSQFQELETFARFGTRLDPKTRRTIEHGRRVREVLKQEQFAPLSAAEQIAVLFAVTEGVFDAIPLSQIAQAQQQVVTAVRNRGGLAEEISRAGGEDPVWEKLRNVLKDTLLPLQEDNADSGATTEKDQDGP